MGNEDLLALANHPDSKVIEEDEISRTTLLPDGRMVCQILDMDKSIEQFKKTEDYRLFLQANNLKETETGVKSI